MIAMPGAWRCELHNLWTTGDCPDCDADLIAIAEDAENDADLMHRWVEPHGDLTACGVRWWNGTRGEAQVTCPTCMTAEYVPLAMEQVEAMVAEVIEANTVWPDPLPSQVTAVMDIVREAMAQAWDEGYDARGVDIANEGLIHTELTPNPYCVIPPGTPADSEPTS